MDVCIWRVSRSLQLAHGVSDAFDHMTDSALGKNVIIAEAYGHISCFWLDLEAALRVKSTVARMRHV